MLKVTAASRNVKCEHATCLCTICDMYIRQNDLSVAITYAHSALNHIKSTISQGQVNHFFGLNIIDVVTLVNVILGNIEPSDTQLSVADINNDGAVNISDIVLLINIMCS